MNIQNTFTQQFGIRYPIIMAPMFLVSNEPLIRAAMENEIAGVFPSLNFRKEGELKSLLERLNIFKSSLGGKQGNYGVNLIVQKNNALYSKHLQECVKAKVPFYIASPGHAGEVIAAAHSYGARVLCDVTNLKYAEKAAAGGCDGFIAVCAGAGGHAGPYPMQVFIPALKKNFPEKVIIAAGAIATGRQMASALILEASGVSIGTRFIASKEASVNKEYKEAILQAGMEDIVVTEKLSGRPTNIINTPYAQKIGYKQTQMEKFLTRNPRTKKYFGKSTHYHKLWSAGQSVEMVKEITGIREIIASLIGEFDSARAEFIN